MTGHDLWDDDDRAIARALHADEPQAAGDPDAQALADYEVVLAYLPFEEVSPPEELEERIVAEALARRPADSISIERARSRRRTRARLAALGGIAVAAAVVVGVLIAGAHSSGIRPQGRIETVSVERADVDAALARPGTRTGTVRGEDSSGKALLESDGNGFLYDLTLPPLSRGETAWLWLSTASGDVRVGQLPDDLPKAVEFHVTGGVDQVHSVFLTREGVETAPSAPQGTEIARANFSPS